MRFSEVRDILDAKVLAGEDFLDGEAFSACGSDFMSDVLAYVKDQGLLLTGLVNPQVIRTADMMDMKCVVIVRGKMPDPSMINLAEERGIVLMSSKERLYNACGKLYQAGLGRE
jgi:predicted transcriptional regulator